MRYALGLAMLALWSTVAAADQTSAQLKARQAQMQQQQAELQDRINTLQKTIERQARSREDALDQLKASETAISVVVRELAELADEEKRVTQEQERLAQNIEQTRERIQVQRDSLADQLRAQYAGGLSPWTALLSGEDPHRIGRELAYLGYVSRSQAQAVRNLQETLGQLEALTQQLAQREAELVALRAQTSQKKAVLEEQKAERAQVLARAETALKQRRTEAETLEQDAQRLEGLVEGLQSAIKEQEAVERRERERLAAERRKREQEAAQRAERERIEREARERETEVVRVTPSEPVTTVEATEAETTPEETAGTQEPIAPLSGLRKGLPAPVQGQVLGRFGAERPDGGIWRGVVLRAPEGTAVRPVAAGRVVYANWLNGFGNLLIVDHGEGYLTVYAYNQSLLKKVGERVGPQDTIARVGATGGQVEPGLYFEIRHGGTPVNPLIWLAR
ncbi:peptidoglycan DD-metalloendopeptidase family protein [Pusillimonas sp. DMV24BSW_D]|uniref:murein hydrolase activator EnvC family protein n=1 Tax=Neopusillimonas aestuarii TaxID=2716226 RepID=UPI00140AA2AF|nr:peptidoglycan DD-metalloendopeptidase family protein [Pusillimonas sp. DMV24BSW_D]QIM48657.1 peptidoglycan DD-metalloendopeptidase family protein [Pusillimonas sp. DMV24BSW_D]